MNDLTAFQRDLLYVVAGIDKPHGLAVKEHLEGYYGRKVNDGRLYPNLDVLVEMGLMEKGKVDERTNYYGLTRRGTREIEDRRQWEQQLIGDLDWPTS